MAVFADTDNYNQDIFRIGYEDDDTAALNYLEDAALADTQPIRSIIMAIRNNEDTLVVNSLTEAGARSLQRILPKFKII